MLEILFTAFIAIFVLIAIAGHVMVAHALLMMHQPLMHQPSDLAETPYACCGIASERR